MALIEIEHLSFRYPDEPNRSLADISLSIDSGQFIVLCGATGCGKTTLLRHLKSELAPAGERSGDIRYAGKSVKDYSLKQLAQEIGFVQQDPDDQIVMEQVSHELFFALENVGCPPDLMSRRVAELSQYFGLQTWFARKTHELSGGQKQLLNLASVLVLHPLVMLLDEPTAQLDPVAARDFLHMIYRLNQELGMTVIITEHRLEEVFVLADRVIVMDGGRIRFDGTPSSVIQSVWGEGESAFRGYLPSLTKLYLRATSGSAAQIPLTVKQGRDWLSSLNIQLSPESPASAPIPAPTPLSASTSIPTPMPAAKTTMTTLLLQCKEVCFQYANNEPLVLTRLTLDLHAEDLLAVLGGNGSGKSTLLQVMCGLLKPQRGAIKFNGQPIHKIAADERFAKIGYLAQNPLLHFAHETVEAELLHAVRRIGKPDATADSLLERFQLQAKRDRHPHDLSGGERQKLALACVLSSEPELLLLDEPTKGLDPQAKQCLGELLQAIHSGKTAVVMVTHDVEFAARYANRCALLFDGQLAADDSPARFFSENIFYTTAVNRCIREWLPNALTEEDVLRQWDGQALLC